MPPVFIHYRPHLVVETNYLEVEIYQPELVCKFGQPVTVIARCLYSVDYSELQPGAQFRIVEGAKEVGSGVVLRRV